LLSVAQQATTFVEQRSTRPRRRHGSPFPHPAHRTSAYCAAKAGLERFGDALRLEVAHRGVTVASAHPTWIDTDLVRDTEAALPTFAATRRQLPGPLGAWTSVEACADALVENLETRGRRVFVPRSVGVVSALRQVVTGALAERVATRVSASRVPQLERDIARAAGPGVRPQLPGFAVGQGRQSSR
jgi:NAD(P)-dependent dehydrogenase (short-subunit alcohol dehydrogenase family)